MVIAIKAGKTHAKCPGPSSRKQKLVRRCKPRAVKVRERETEAGEGGNKVS